MNGAAMTTEEALTKAREIPVDESGDPFGLMAHGCDVIEALVARDAELSREVRRLRMILDGIAKAGAGIGAVVECYVVTDEHAGFAVCRGDGDEAAFGESMRWAIGEFATFFAEEKQRVVSMSVEGAPSPTGDAR